MDHGVVGICLIVLYVLFLSLPETIYIRLKAPLSLRYSMAGVVGAAALALVVFDVWRRTFEIPYREGSVLIGMCLLSPLWFSIGARRSLREVGSHRAKVLRWMNVVGFALSVGLIAGFLMAFARMRYYGLVIPLTTAAVVVLAISRVVHWQPPTRFRWAGFLPRYPAILLMPAVLVVWAVLCTYGRDDFESETNWIGWGFPLLFYEGRWGPAADYSGYRFRLIPYLVDLLLAVVVAWVLAMAADRLVPRSVRPRRWWREVRSMRLRWPRFLPGFPAVLLVPAVLGRWARLCGTNSHYDWSSLSDRDDLWVPVHPERGPMHMQGEPWNNPRGFPFRYSGSFEPWEGGGYVWSGFQIHWFLIDLTIALTVAYLFAMVIDRLLFPAIRARQGRKRGTGEAG